MPGYVLHMGATVMCAHAGQAQPTASVARVKVMGQPVVVQTTQYSVAGCALASSGSPPCATAQWMTGATRVMALGAPVLLQDSQSLCTPTGTPLTIAVVQARVKAT
jgi:hypothetical protein